MFIQPEYEEISKRDIKTKYYRVGENRYFALINTKLK